MHYVHITSHPLHSFHGEVKIYFTCKHKELIAPHHGMHRTEGMYAHDTDSTPPPPQQTHEDCQDVQCILTQGVFSITDRKTKQPFTAHMHTGIVYMCHDWIWATGVHTKMRQTNGVYIYIYMQKKAFGLKF